MAPSSMQMGCTHGANAVSRRHLGSLGNGTEEGVCEQSSRRSSLGIGRLVPVVPVDVTVHGAGTAI
jgi:hypothetical protein